MSSDAKGGGGVILLLITVAVVGLVASCLDQSKARGRVAVPKPTTQSAFAQS